jgi:hypothetical protein
MAAGAAAPGGSYSPAPTQTSVPVYGSATTAAVFGGVDSSSPAPYTIGDWAYNGLCQQVAVPSNGATVTAEVWESGNDYPGTHLDMVDLVGVVDGSQNLIGYLYAENKETAASPGDTAYRQIIVDIPQTVFGGQTINLFLGQYAFGGSGSKYYDYWFVDDVNVTAGEPTNASTSILRKPGAAIRR